MNATVTQTTSSSVALRSKTGWAEVGLVAFLAAAYSVICALAPVVPATAFRHAHDILALERWFGIDIELGVNQWLHARPGLAALAAMFYSASFFLVTLTALAIVWRSSPRMYDLARNGLFAMTAGAMITYWVYPLAPPRFLSSLGYVDAVATQSSLGSSYSSAAAVLANPYGAMPSMHAGWAIWSAFVLGTFVWRRWWQRLLVCLHPALTVWVIIATANHYVLDAFAGAAYCAIGFALSYAFRRASKDPNRLIQHVEETQAPA